jgi:hypothetical protein
MALTIQRINFDPVTGDNPSEGFMKTDLNVAEIATAIDGDGTPENPGIESRLSDVEAAAKDVGTTPGTVAAGDDARFSARGRRNLLINGGARLSQAGFAGGSVSANTYAYDGWRAFGSASSFSRAVGRSVMTLNGTIGQILETPDLAGATVTVSVTNPTGPITVNLQPDATTAGVSGTITAGSGVRSCTLVIPSSITGNVFLLLTTSGNVTFDATAKQGGIQLELGSFASQFEVRTLQEELALCQRYYCKSFDTDVAPAFGLQGRSMVGNCYSAAQIRTTALIYPQVMRAPPTVTLYTSNATGTNANTWSAYTAGGSYANPSSISIGGDSSSFSATLTFSGLTFGTAYMVNGNFVADARL